MKTAELLEQRGAILDRMKAADAANNTADFDKADAELKELDTKLERAKRIDAIERAETGEPINGDTKLDAELRNKFSITRAIAGAAGLGVDDGFEREMQAELAKRAGRKPQGVFIPTECFEKRVLTTSAGAELVSTDHRPDQYISALTQASVVRGLGARVLSGLTGNITIPKETGSPAHGWVAENAALSSSDADFANVTMDPKHAGALSEWSRNMLLQSSPDVEGLLRNMLARDLALVIDRAAIQGGGTNEPTGVLATTGIQSEAYATSLFATTAEMIEKCDVANVGMAQRSFLSSNTVKKIAMTAQDTDTRPVGLGTIFHGENTTFSNQVPIDLGAGDDEHTLLYADWSEFLMGIWSEIDILVNPYESTAYSKGNVSIRAMATVDCAVRHPAAFVSATGVTASAVGIA